MNTHISVKFFRRFCTILLSSSLAIGAWVTPTFASDPDKDALSNELTTMFRSARAVISQNQGLINDASKGDKGLSAEVVIAKANENFIKATGHDFGSDAAHEAMLSAIGSVMDQAQPLINEKDKGLKGFLPAIFAKQVADAFSSNMAGKMQIKLTAPKAYVRNRANRPDKWEQMVIEEKFKATGYAKGKPFSEIAKAKGKDAYRYILPEYYKDSCLKCHGDPKGERDITGGKKEGGKLGELGGAISLTIFK
ncbi:Two-component system sensor histidine kinase [hydrothermal vent metagenome]|uniref:Two-component system sensor histidine kinase n=1 Tax=hydrothermal vent metagenome TaxID=652676 RepID=A0A3B1BIZ1_9ZZZZ